MKTSKFPITFLMAAVVLLISLACGTVTVTTPEPQTQEVVTEAPTEAPTEVVTEAPTEAPTEAQEQFFTEEFDSDPGWNFFVIGPGADANEDKATYEFDSSLMVFNIDAKQLYAYYIYNQQSYEDVRVDIHFDNRGVNSQNVSLICRASDEGWYELSIGSDGMWYLYAVSNNKYNLVQSGGSTAIKQGKAVNEYGMACEGNKISVFINGVEPKNTPVTDKKYVLRRGGVGFNVSSLNSIPVKVEIDWFKVSQP
jgi:hypothetical protein